MQIAMTLSVRDEIDIIQTTIEYHLDKVDFLIVTDNGSVDGTWDYLNTLDSSRVTLIREMELNKNQFLWVDRMIRLAADKGADWVINLDADEFCLGNLREEISKQEERGRNYFDIPWCNFVWTYRDNESEPCIPKRMLWRGGKEHKESKAVHKTEGYERISQGNHVAFLTRKKSGGRTSRLDLCHYTNRGWEPWCSKIIMAGEAYKKNTLLSKVMGGRIRGLYGVYQQRGLEGLKKEWSKDSALCEDDIKRMQLVFDPRLACEFGASLPELLQREASL